MQQWTTPPSDAQDVAVLLFPQFSNHCLANAVEPLRAVNTLLMREAYRWRFVTLDGGRSRRRAACPSCRMGGCAITPAVICCVWCRATACAI